MSAAVEPDSTLLGRRQDEWGHWLANPDQNPLSTRASFAGSGMLLENELCVYSQDSRFSGGLPYSGFIVTKAVRQTVFDLTPAEAAATHAPLAEVRAHLDRRVQPGGSTVGWNVLPAGVPHAHVIPHWNTDLAARGRGDRAVSLFSSRAGPYWQRLGFGPVPPTGLSAALSGTPQLSSGECQGWIHGELAWKLDFSG